MTHLRAFCFALSPFFVVAPGCVGDSSNPLPDGSTDSSFNDAAGDATNDVASDSASDADSGPPPCGAPGETCCGGGLAPCNDGLSCSASKCLVSEAWAVGKYVYVAKGNSFPSTAFVVAHYDGATWSLGTPVKENPPDLNSYDPIDIYEQGTDVRIIANEADVGHEYWWSGVSWQACGPGQACMGPTITSYIYAITSVSNGGAVDYWLAGSGLMSRCAATASSCASVMTGLSSGPSQGTFAGWTGSDLYYADYGQVLHFNGSAWTPTAVTEALVIGGSSTTDLWAGYHKLQHWDGKQWSSAYLISGSPAPGGILSIGATSPSDVHAVGNDQSQNGGSFAAHWDGTAWKLQTLPPMTFVQKVWAPSPIEAFVVGGAATSDNVGVIAHWNGSKWSAMSPPTVSMTDESKTGGVVWVSVTGQARPRGM